MKTALFTLLLVSGFGMNAQTGDFILLQKKGRTIASWFPGTNISITTNRNVYLEAMVTQIKNDTIFLRQFIVQQVYTRLGVYVLDTIGSYRYQYHYNEVKAIGRTGRKFNLSASSASLIGGGILLTIANGVVYLVDREKFSPELMIASVGLGTLGVIMAKTTGKGMLIGKKYSLLYVEAAAEKKPI